MAAYGQPRFEVASVRPGPPDAIGSMNGGPLPVGPFNQTNHDPTRITWNNVRLGRVIQVAFDLPAARISGPDWLPDDVVTIVATIPEGASVGDFRLMVRNLLADRFKLTTHREIKQVSGYALEFAKNGRSSRNRLRVRRRRRGENRSRIRLPRVQRHRDAG